MKPRLRVCMMCLLVIVLFSPPAWSGPRDHEGDFFLRLSLGGGAANTSLDLGLDDLEVSGASADINLAVGKVVTPNLAIHATLFGWIVENPDVEFGGQVEVANADLDMAAIGGGLTYYFMPINIYVSGSFGIATLTVDGPEGEEETDTGFATDLTLGKEWWVSDRWGLGVSGGFGYNNIPEEGFAERWSGVSFAFRFSATFN